MVNVVKEKIDPSQYERIYAFGAGKLFSSFAENNLTVCVKAVIDNFSEQNALNIAGNHSVKVIRLSEFSAVPAFDAAIIITTGYYKEVIEQLDSNAKFDGIDVYIYSWWGKSAEEIESLHEALMAKRERLSAKASNNNRHQIWNLIDEGVTAGAKAPRDIHDIMRDYGYKDLLIHAVSDTSNGAQYKWQQRRNEEDWARGMDQIREGDILFLQHYLLQSNSNTASMIPVLKAKRKVKVITLVHDIENVRQICNTSQMISDFEAMLDYTDVFIVHNEAMKEYFIAQGISEAKIVCLEVFDYLSSWEISERRHGEDIVIAGNFDTSKSGYIGHLGEIHELKFHLFGANYKEEACDNIVYHGVFPPEQLGGMLPDGFGLVWDGDSLDTCSGNTGEYLRYNNPHKLSLYIASGLPIIIWEEAAEKDFVIENNLGLAIKSLRDLPEVLSHVTDTQYDMYRDNAKRMAEKLCRGEYTKNAVGKAESMLARNLKFPST